MTTGHQLVSVYLNEADQWEGQPLYLGILKFLARSGCAGATVLRAAAGFTGGQSPVPLSLGTDEGRKPPLVVQFVERASKVSQVLATVRKMAGMRLITVQTLKVVGAAAAKRGK